MSRSSVEEAVAGSEAVFGVSPLLILLEVTNKLIQVTNYYDADNFDAQKVQGLSGTSEPAEVVQGKNLIAAAKKAEVKFFVWRYVTPQRLMRTATDSLLESSAPSRAPPTLPRHSTPRIQKLSITPRLHTLIVRDDALYATAEV